ncbi:GNAT family N-acetyltransferase [Aureimonas frigidaquae]|uniref:Acetyltransferase n=1 Tax=Aureimonas frigidaquae TaxID=424757 RepID=A0A0P0Z096_9HYPH|nr:GNAT family N-acetyltransferase [Aureimonas frigidaquae]BAT27223.1 acetyltransferase [Aureimonas frigidaquae]
MDIKHEDHGRGGLFVTGEGDQRAELTYSPAGLQQDAWVFDHTYVPESLRGQGIAEKLLDYAVDFARQKGKKVVPACSYVRAQFERHPDKYADLATEEAKPFGRV